MHTYTVFMYACTHAQHTCEYVYLYAYINCIPICMHSYVTYTCICIFICIHKLYPFMHSLCLALRMYKLRLFVCIYFCISVCMCVYIHTHAHIHCIISARSIHMHYMPHMQFPYIQTYAYTHPTRTPISSALSMRTYYIHICSSHTYKRTHTPIPHALLTPPHLFHLCCAPFLPISLKN